MQAYDNCLHVSTCHFIYSMSYSHFIASAHRELPVKGSPHDVAQVERNTFIQIPGICALTAPVFDMKLIIWVFYINLFWGIVLHARFSFVKICTLYIKGIFFLHSLLTGKITTIQCSLLCPGQWDEDPGHHTS